MRTQVLVAGAILGSDGRKLVLRLGLRGPWRERFAALLQRLTELAHSMEPARYISTDLGEASYGMCGLIANSLRKALELGEIGATFLHEGVAAFLGFLSLVIE